MAVLRAIAGPIKGAVFRVGQEEVIVGRLSSSHLCIGDPSVSRQHCILQQTANEFRIRDLGSNNGTFLNGQRINAGVLADGDKIRIGDTILSFSESDVLSVPDNGVMANSYIQTPVSECAATALRK